MSIDDLLELDEIVMELEGIRDLLGMLSDSANEGAVSIAEYDKGILHIFLSTRKAVDRLGKLTEKINEERRAAAKP